MIIAQNIQDSLAENLCPQFLSKNALYKIASGADKKATKDDYFIVQVVENRKKESTEAKEGKIK